MRAKYIMVLSVAIMVSMVSIISGQPQPGSPWPMFHYNALHTGLSLSYTGPSVPALAWSYAMYSGVYSSPTIGSDGRVYSAGDTGDSNIYCFSSGGGLVWSYLTLNWIGCAPAIGADGNVHVTTAPVTPGDNNLYCISSSGALAWSYHTIVGSTSSPAIGSDGAIYFGTAWQDNNIYCLKSIGSLVWSYRTGLCEVASSPAIGGDGRIYFGSFDPNNIIYCLESAGTLKWSYLVADSVYSSAAIGSDGKIYMGSSNENSTDNNIYSMNSNGTLAWSYATVTGMYSSAAIGSDGRIYIGSNNGDNNIYSLNPAGALAWSYTSGSGVHSSPAIGSDGMVYVGSRDCNLYCLTSAGGFVWTFSTGDEVYCSPAIGSDGRIYVGSGDTNVYCIGQGPTATMTPTTTPTPTPCLGIWYDCYGPDGTCDVVQIGQLYVAAKQNGLGGASESTMNWDDAVAWAAGLVWLGETDWRLPTKDELIAICSVKGVADCFTYKQRDWAYPEDNVDNAWYVRFNDCRAFSYDKSALTYARVVLDVPTITPTPTITPASPTSTPTPTNTAPSGGTPTNTPVPPTATPFAFVPFNIRLENAVQPPTGALNIFVDVTVEGTSYAGVPCRPYIAVSAGGKLYYIMIGHDNLTTKKRPCLNSKKYIRWYKNITNVDAAYIAFSGLAPGRYWVYGALLNKNGAPMGPIAERVLTIE